MKPASFEIFSDLRERNIMTLKETKENQGRVIGIYCTYGPKELAIAADAIPVSLCGTREAPIAAAEEHLPRNLCPLVKSSYGFAVSDTCPYFHFSDLVIGETTCDGKKKMFELMEGFKPVHVMHLPQMPDYKSSLELMYQEIVRLKEKIESFFNIEIDEQAIWEAIRVVNANNRALKDFFDLNQARPALISGLDMLNISWQLSFHADQWEKVHLLEKLTGEIKGMAKEGYAVGEPNTPRILLTGTPVGVGSEKVVALVEECGGLVVAMENCGGYKTVALQVDESDQSQDPLRLLAEKYLRIPCSVMYNNKGRFELLEQMISDFQIDGVIDLTWQACHTYNIESYRVGDLVKNKMGLPFMQLESDYSTSDLEILRTRIQAFLEML